MEILQLTTHQSQPKMQEQDRMRDLMYPGWRNDIVLLQRNEGEALRSNQFYGEQITKLIKV